MANEVAVIRRGIGEHRKLHLEYTREDGQQSERAVRPLGLYFWGDFCDNGIHSFRRSGQTAVDHQTWDTLTGVDGLVSFGEDGDGELYVVSYLNGTVFKIVPSG